MKYPVQGEPWKGWWLGNGLPMRVVEEGGVEGSATVAAYDWLAGWGETSSGFSSSFSSTCSSPESNSLQDQSRLETTSHHLTPCDVTQAQTKVQL